MTARQWPPSKWFTSPITKIRYTTFEAQHTHKKETYTTKQKKKKTQKKNKQKIKKKKTNKQKNEKK